MTDRQRDIEILISYFGALSRVAIWHPKPSREMGWFLYQLRSHLKAKRELRQKRRKHREMLKRYGVWDWWPPHTQNPADLARDIVDKYNADPITIEDLRKAVRMLKHSPVRDDEVYVRQLQSEAVADMLLRGFRP